MSQRVEQATAWIYRGLWAILVRWFKVPDRPPTLPIPPGESLEVFQPARGFLSYLKFFFWLIVVTTHIALLYALTIVTIVLPWLGVLLSFVILPVAIAFDMLAYVGIHLRFDSTWYVMTSRSLRIRRGVWIIHETTITFENVQNVEVRQGPVQRHFGIADVHVDTAGGGGKAVGNKGGAESSQRGRIEGIHDAHRIRDLILTRLRCSTSTGLGDEATHGPSTAGWTAEHVDVLREIRNLIVQR
jgi:membrane protein YdbS with pleckstrin-like domain